MKNPICWICNINLAHKQYSEHKLLDENGNKPCIECWQEDQYAEEEDTNEF